MRKFWRWLLRVLGLGKVLYTGPTKLEEVKAGFLLDGAGTRTMNFSGPHKSEGDLHHILNRFKEMGFNTWLAYTQNEGDATPRPYSLTDHTGNISGDVQAQMVSKVKLARARGFGVVLCVWADDNRSFHRWPRDVKKRYLKAVVETFDKLVIGYWMGLEVDEYMGHSEFKDLVGYMNGITDKPLIGHQKPGRANYSHTSGLDAFAGQFGWQTSPAGLDAKAKSMLSQLPGNMPLILGEYDKSSNRGLGKAVIGRNERYISYWNG